MTTYLVLSTITQVQSDYGTIGRIEVAQYRTHADANQAGIDRYTRLPSDASAELIEATNLTDAEIEAKGEEWLENLISRIEKGEI